MIGSPSQLTASSSPMPGTYEHSGPVPETPILDLLRPLPKPLHPRPRRTLTYSLLAIAIIGLVSNNFGLLTFYASLVFVFALVIATHELGHLAAGWLVGLRFVSVAIGSLSLVREEGRARVRFKRSVFWGLAGMSLVRLPGARKKLIVYVLGGPLASLACGLGTIALAPILDPHLGNMSSAMYSLFAYLSLFIFFIGLFPAKIGNLYPNDALLLKMLVTSHPGARQLLASYAVRMQHRNGVDPININRRWTELAFSLGAAAHREYFANWRSYQSNADNNPVGAAESIEKCLAGSAILSEEERNHLVAETTWFAARYRKDPAKADTWFKRIRNTSELHPLMALRVKIAIDSTNGNYSEALQACGKALLFLSQFPQGTRARALEPAWQAWRRELERLQTASETA